MLPATHEDFTETREAAAMRPKRAVLACVGDELAYASWTLTRCADGSVLCVTRNEPRSVYRIDVNAPGMKHWWNDELKSVVTLAGAAPAAATPTLAPAPAAPAPAVPAAPQPACAVPDDLAAWLAPLSLSAYGTALCATLGVAALADVADCEDCDLQSIGLLPVQRKKFLREAAKLAGGGAAAEAALPAQQLAAAAPAGPASAPAAALLPLACVRALVVGCEAYGSPLSRLANPVSDARALGAALRSLPGASVTELHNPGRAELLRALRDFSDPPKPAAAAKGMSVAAAAPAAGVPPQRTLGLFFFSGHGLQVNGVNYLVPADFALPSHPRLDDVEDGCVALDEALRKMRYGGFFVSALVLDCCRNVPDFLPGAHKGAGGGGGPMGRGLAPMAAVPPAENDGGGTLVAFATAAGDVALDASTRAPANSPFTAALLSFLSPAARGEAAPPLLSLTTHLVSEVRADTHGKQIPYTNMSLSKEAGELRLWR
jgi:uncharacterized caspase-like protein